MARARGEGSVFRNNQHGGWWAQLVVNGKKVRRAAANQQAAVRELAEMRRQRDRGVDPTKLTVAEFMQQWLQSKQANGARVNTMRSYESYTRAHITPLLGRYVVGALTPRNVEDATLTITKRGSSGRTAAHMRAVLATALHDAERWGLVERNVAQLAVPPRVDAKERTAYTADQVYALLAALDEHPHKAAYMLAALLGLREGEVLALRWQDVGVVGGATWQRDSPAASPEIQTLQIQRTVRRVDGRPVYEPPKTHRSRRLLPVPPSIVAALRESRVRQLEDRLMAEGLWQDEDLVFAGPTGGALSPVTLLRHMYAAQKAAGLPRVTFHDLRHSAASMLAHEGVPAVMAAAILGHARIATTLEVYTHVAEADLRKAVDRVAARVDRGS